MYIHVCSLLLHIQVQYKAETSLPCLDYRRKRADLFQVFWYCKGFDLQNGDLLFIVDKSMKTKVTINVYQAENLVLRAITDWN